MFLGESIETLRNDILMLIECSKGYFNINTIEELDNDDFNYYLSFYIKRNEQESNDMNNIASQNFEEYIK